MIEIPRDHQEWFDDQAHDIFDTLICQGEDSEFVQAVTLFDDVYYRRQAAIDDLIRNLQRGTANDDVWLVGLEEEISAFESIADTVMQEPGSMVDRLALLAGLASSSSQSRVEHYNSIFDSPDIVLAPYEMESMKGKFLDTVSDDPDLTEADYIEKLTDIYRRSIVFDTRTLEHNLEKIVGFHVPLSPSKQT